MRVLGDINPSLTAPPDSSARAGESQRFEAWERLADDRRDISDIPLKSTDERYRLECDRLREDAAREAAGARRGRPSSSTRPATVEDLRAVGIHNVAAGVGDVQVNLGSVSSELTQEHRQRKASESFASLGYVTQTRSTRRRNGAPWTLLLVLMMTLAGVVGYGYLAMRRNGLSPWQLPGVQTAIMLHQRVDAAQSRASADLAVARQRSSQLVAAGQKRWARWRR